MCHVWLVWSDYVNEEFLGVLRGFEKWKDWGENGEIFRIFLCNFWVFLLYNFENTQSEVCWIDASEIWRSLSNESLNIAPFCYKLVKVHLTNCWINVCTGKNSIILYYFKYFIFGRFWHHFIWSNCILSCIARYIVTWYIKMWYIVTWYIIVFIFPLFTIFTIITTIPTINYIVILFIIFQIITTILKFT